MSRSLRYVVLHHTEIEMPHFDFLFELDPGDERLFSLRCPCWPVEVGDRLEEIGKHRRDYLSYEGPISNDRGSVRRVDEGTLVWQVLHDDPFTIGLRLQSIRSLEFVIALRSTESAFDVLSVK